jgi:prevent-host-death family protein
MAIIAILSLLMRSTNIADLRNRLTQYLREVRAGEEIIVRDRQRPIAKIVPFTVDGEDADDAALVASGLMRKGSGAIPPSFCNCPSLLLADGERTGTPAPTRSEAYGRLVGHTAGGQERVRSARSWR